MYSVGGAHRNSQHFVGKIPGTIGFQGGGVQSPAQLIVIHCRPIQAGRALAERINITMGNATTLRAKGSLITQRALRDRLMSRGKNCLPTVSRQFLTRNYPRPNCLLKCLSNCLSPTREGLLSSFKINPTVRVIARQVRDKNCLAAIFAPRHQSVSSGPLGSEPRFFTRCDMRS